MELASTRAPLEKLLESHRMYGVILPMPVAAHDVEMLVEEVVLDQPAEECVPFVAKAA